MGTLVARVAARGARGRRRVPLRRWLPAAALSVAASLPARAQELPTVTPGFAAGEWLEADASLELRLSARPAAGSLAVMLGETDLTALFEATRGGLVYRPRGVRLPPGEHALVVYHVAADGRWTEIGRFETRILTAGGFREVSVAPKLALHNEGQVAEGHSAAAVAPVDPTYQRFTVNTGLSTSHVRSGFTVRTQANVVGVGERERALRYTQERDAAPLVDLADYLLMYERRSVKVAVGHVAFGGGRHLIQQLGSRGVTAAVRPVGFAELSVGVMGGRPRIGWQHPLGIGEGGSRLIAGRLGLEVFPSRPGMLRIDGMALDGAVPARSGYNQGAVTDLEESWGGELSIRATDPSRRVELEASWARSRFAKPPDPFLSGGRLIIPLQPGVQNARYAGLRAELVRARLSPSLPASLTAAVRHERVEPLYRSVVSSTRADLEENTLELGAALGPARAQVARAWAEDNLDRIPSILRTLARRDRATVSVPLAVLAGPSAAGLLPHLSYGYDRVHQYGAELPVGGEFQEGHVPDQLSRHHVLRLDWYAGATRIGYAFDRSDQDNRQPGREAADFRALVHTASLGFTPVRILDVGLDLSHETAESLERDETSRNARVGGSLDLRVTRSTTVAVQASANRTTQDPVDLRQTGTDLRLQLSQRVTLHRRAAGATAGQLFVRFARHSVSATGLGAFADPRRTWTLNTGFTLSVF